MNWKTTSKEIENSSISVTLTFTSVWAKLISMALKIFEYESFLNFRKWYALFVYKIKWKKFKLLLVK